MSVPAFGLGTFRLQGQVVIDSVSTALELGYRHIDTAQIYENEADVGEAIAASGKSPDASLQINFAFRCAISRTANAEEQKLLQNLLDQSRHYYADHRDEADKLLAIGLKPAPDDLDCIELASWTIVARSILSMNEVLTRN